VDATRVNVFLLARGLLDQARTSETRTAPGAMSAVVLCDLAVETAAKAVHADRGPSSIVGAGYALRKADLASAPHRDPSLPWVLDRLLASARERRSDQDFMPGALVEARRLHERRNAVQHDGSVPSPHDAERARSRARAFLEFVSDEFYGVEFWAISRASLVMNDGIREVFESAERAAGRGELRDAMTDLSLAFLMARDLMRGGRDPFRAGREMRALREALQSLTPKKRPSMGTTKRLGDLLKAIGMGHFEAKELVEAMVPPEAAFSGALEQTVTYLAMELNRLEERIDAISLAGNASEYVWFRHRVPEPRRSRGTPEREWTIRDPSPPYTEDEFTRAADFVIDAVLLWEGFPQPPETAADG
jgi:hypothetical protein